MAYDPRAICNLILDEAGRSAITHVALQKLLYFAHGLHLQRTGEPLVSGYFEAWKHGPVHPAVYKSFKKAGSASIGFRAEGRDVLTGESKPLLPNIDDEAYQCVRQTVAAYGNMTAWTLVDISHAKGAPWDLVVEKAKEGIALGLRIPNNLIAGEFKKHKISIRNDRRTGEPDEETPLDYSDRSGQDRAAQ
jgi:uncharacterized phage-associated protein